MSAPDLRGTRVVFLNWRDLAHPQAGGAELYCQSVAERFAAQGAEVTLLAARVRGEASRERVRGVALRRLGGTYTVYLLALLWLLRNRRRIDAVVDCQNGIPFFSPLVLRRRTAVVCLTHHVHHDQWRQLSWPMRIVGPLLEGPVSRRVYEGAAFVAVSPSTRRDMRRRLRLRGPIQVVPNGMNAIPAAEPRRSPTPRITCVGRLVPHKRLELLLEALPQARAAVPDLRVDLVGDGPERARLEGIVAELALGDVVTFHGRVDDATRDRLLGAAWLTVQPSHHEGWGLTVLEANARGVPALAFRVPGLRDAVRPDTGWLVAEGSPLGPALVEALETLADPGAAAAIAQRARTWAAGFSWEATAARLAALVIAERDRGTHAPRERRRPTDLVVQARLALPAGAGAAAGRRRTDVWTVADGEATALFYGADERDVEAALGRLGLEPTAVGVARPIDLLASGAAGT